MEPDFPCLADELAEPLPDMNTKVAAFTVSEKSSNRNALIVHAYIQSIYTYIYVQGHLQNSLMRQLLKLYSL